LEVLVFLARLPEKVAMEALAPQERSEQDRRLVLAARVVHLQLLAFQLFTQAAVAVAFPWVDLAALVVAVAEKAIAQSPLLLALRIPVAVAVAFQALALIQVKTAAPASSS